MKPQKQAFLHEPDKGIYGDCYRTVMACLLDMDRDEIPHSHEGWAEFKEANAQWQAMRGFLAERGLREVVIPLLGTMPIDDVLACMSNSNPGLHWLLLGTSRSGVSHVVICRDGEIVWDPSIVDSGITGPASDGNWWVSFLGRDL